MADTWYVRDLRRRLRRIERNQGPPAALSTLPEPWKAFIAELVGMLEDSLEGPILISGGIHCTDETLALFRDLVGDVADCDPPLLLQVGAGTTYRASEEVREIEAPLMIDWSDLTR